MIIALGKEATKNAKITRLNDAPVYYIPLSQHAGNQAIPVVAQGDYVKRFQLIGKATGEISANVHSPVSGKVKDITLHPVAGGKLAQVVIIENDFKNEEEERSREKTDYRKLNRQQLLEIVENAGIVGQGGGQFPTHIKYNTGTKPIKTLIVNGMECEPYLTADYSLMNECNKALFNGIRIAMRILNAEQAVVAIEKQNEELIFAFNNMMNKLAHSDVVLKILPGHYPQGSEAQLIKYITRKEIPHGMLPADIGVVVSNVATLVSLSDAVTECKPLVERIITVTGNLEQGAGNYLVKTGTPLSHILNELKIEPDDTLMYILGGAMMGKGIIDLGTPVTKGSSGLVLLKRKRLQIQPCISCNYCHQVCPVHLQPHKFYRLCQSKKYSRLPLYYLNDCLACGMCQYICPSHLPLMDSIMKGKEQLKTAQL